MALIIERMMNEEARAAPVRAASNAAEISAQLLEEFRSLLGVDINLEDAQSAEIMRFIERVGVENLHSAQHRAKSLIYILNVKLKANEGPIKNFIDEAAGYGLFFNHHQRLDIAQAFNGGSFSDLGSLFSGLEGKATEAALSTAFEPRSSQDLMTLLRDELAGTLNRRTKEREPHRARDLMLSLLGAYVYRSFEEEAVHQANDPVPREDYERDYWLRLTEHRAKLHSRNRTLSIRVISPAEVNNREPVLRNELREWIQNEHDLLSNHGFIALIFNEEAAGAWSLIEDVMLFAERFKSDDNPPAFFRGKRLWQELQEELALPAASEGAVRQMFEGFLFKDSYVVGSDGDQRTMLIFQKSVRDETPLPCPACRSHDTRSNSYPSLGVRSWECASWICPDRSRSNRGKRFAFWSLLCQQGLMESRNIIPRAHVRAWSRDVIEKASLVDCLNMLIRHYSLAGDGVSIQTVDADQSGIQTTVPGRDVAYSGVNGASGAVDTSAFDNFRSLYSCKKVSSVTPVRLFYSDLLTEIIHGDASDALTNIPESTVDGAVTSPPYYNAREYAQWSNIYTHVAAMRSIAAGVFKVLKPGSIYLYNVFDYFDNDNTIVSSAMGNRRIILSAYTADAFASVGFELCGNIAWDKGEIEGKRAFNGGNFSPFYQAPFNCWEHILVFRKPGGSLTQDWPRIWRCPPVKKMFGGENKHGHTAPFPDALPGLLVDRLAPGAVILDPFAGSLTTGRVARRKGVRSICIEQSLEYCELGLEMMRQEDANIPLLI